MKRDDKDLAAMEAMRRATIEAQALIADDTADAFAADRVKSLALERLLQRLADAAHRVSKHSRAVHSEVPWDRLDLLRETVSTENEAIDARVLFAIVTREGQPLVQALDDELPSDAA